MIMSKEILDSIIKNKQTDKNIFLLWGEEDYLRAYYKKNLSSLFMPENMPELNFYAFDGKEYSLAAVDEAIDTLPTFDENKLLIFDNSMIFKPSGAKAEVKEYWENKLKDIPQNVYIIFNESEIDKRSTLYKFISKNHIAAEFSYLEEGKMIKWTQTLFKKLGKSISAEDCTYLLSLCTDGMMTVKNEAEKLCSYAADRQTITKDDINLLVTPKLEDKVFDMVGAMLSKNTDRAITLLRDLFALKTEPIQILGAIMYNVEKLACVKVLLDAKRTRPEIASTLKIAPFQANKYVDNATKFKEDELNKLVKKTAETDMLLKSNSMNNNVLLEVFIMEASSKH